MSLALLVCGSRSLANTEKGSAWACATIAHEFYQLRLGDAPGDILVQGGAPGPDSWAQDEGSRIRGLKHSLWRPSGRLSEWVVGQGGSRTLSWWTTSPNPELRRRPLDRNDAMLRFLVQHLAADPNNRALVLALLDPTSPTHGTGYVVRNAGNLNLDVQVRRYP